MDIKEDEKFFIYSIEDEKEKIDYLLKNTNALNGINLEDIEQIESDYCNNVYVLLKKGKVYRNGEYFIDEICKVYFTCFCDVYLISKSKKIIPAKPMEQWHNLDFYLNNKFESYEKIITDNMYLTALTKEKRVISVYIGFDGVGIIPENFINVDDILHIEEVPYIVKNNKTIPLYVMSN